MPGHIGNLGDREHQRAAELEVFWPKLIYGWQVFGTVLREVQSRQALNS